jgi:hypothetical protein
MKKWNKRPSMMAVEKIDGVILGQINVKEDGS